MSSGPPVCPICQKERHDGKKEDITKPFDTTTLCKNCMPDTKVQPSIQVLKELLSRFEVDALAFYHRKKILLELMKNEKSGTTNNNSTTI